MGDERVSDGERERSRLVVALDGPGSSGKSTVGMEAARRLGYRFCDTGLLYRAVTWLALERAVPADETPGLIALAGEVHLIPDTRERLRRVEVDGVDVTPQVRTARVDRAVSDYSRIAGLRAALVPRQRAIAEAGRIIVAGRDIGTVILPAADLKLYLDASAEERARRRLAQRSNREAEVQVLDELRRRDAIDSGRAVAPLRIATDAVVLRTDGNSFNQTVREVVSAIRAAEGVVFDASGAHAGDEIRTRAAAAAADAAARVHGSAPAATAAVGGGDGA